MWNMRRNTTTRRNIYNISLNCKIIVFIFVSTCLFTIQTIDSLFKTVFVRSEIKEVKNCNAQPRECSSVVFTYSGSVYSLILWFYTVDRFPPKLSIYLPVFLNHE